MFEKELELFKNCLDITARNLEVLFEELRNAINEQPTVDTEDK